jgi:hypothetical protein
MPALRLSDSELDIVMNACRPLAPEQRDAFLTAVAHALRETGGEIGPGSIHRAIRVLQHSFFDPPNLDGAPDDEPPRLRRRSNGKYAR